MSVPLRLLLSYMLALVPVYVFAAANPILEPTSPALSTGGYVQSFPLQHIRVESISEPNKPGVLLHGLQAFLPRTVHQVYGDTTRNAVYVTAESKQAVNACASLIHLLDQALPSVSLQCTVIDTTGMQLDLPRGELGGGNGNLGEDAVSYLSKLATSGKRPSIVCAPTVVPCQKSISPVKLTAETPLVLSASAAYVLGGGKVLLGINIPEVAAPRWVELQEGQTSYLGAFTLPEGKTMQVLLTAAVQQPAIEDGDRDNIVQPSDTPILELIPLHFLQPSDAMRMLGKSSEPREAGDGLLISFVPDGIEQILAIDELGALLVQARTHEAVEQLSDFLRLCDNPSKSVCITMDLMAMPTADTIFPDQQIDLNADANWPKDVIEKAGAKRITSESIIVKNGLQGMIHTPKDVPVPVSLWMTSVLIHPDDSVSIQAAVLTGNEETANRVLSFRVRNRTVALINSWPVEAGAVNEEPSNLLLFVRCEVGTTNPPQ